MSKKVYFVDIFCGVDSVDYDASSQKWIDAMKSIGNCFDTYEEAQVAASKIKEIFKNK